MKIVKFILFVALSLGLGSDGAETETASNRLSVPVLKVDGTFDSATTPFFYQPVTDPERECAVQGVNTSFAPTDFCYYDPDTDTISWLQKQSGTFWQAEVITPLLGENEVMIVDAIDTGDLLESGGVKSNKQIRIEFTLLQEVDDTLMAFPMQGPLLGTSGVGEVHGTSAFNTLNIDGSQPNGFDNLDLVPAEDVLSSADGLTTLNALVYSECARLSIQSPPQNSDAVFDYTSGSWNTGGSMALAPINMTTEITVSGRITYGYVWNRAGLTPGWYRLNFYLDPQCDCRTLILANETAIINAGEKYITQLIEPDPEDDCGGGAYIDIELGGSGGGGGGSGGGKGGSGGGKGGTGSGTGGSGSGKKGSSKKGVGETYARKVRHTRHRRHRRHHRHDHNKPNKKGGLRNRE